VELTIKIDREKLDEALACLNILVGSGFENLDMLEAREAEEERTKLEAAGVLLDALDKAFMEAEV